MNIKKTYNTLYLQSVLEACQESRRGNSNKLRFSDEPGYILSTGIFKKPKIFTIW